MQHRLLTMQPEELSNRFLLVIVCVSIEIFLLIRRLFMEMILKNKLRQRDYFVVRF